MASIRSIIHCKKAFFFFFMSDILKCFKAFQNPKVSFRHIVYICAFVRPTCEYKCALYQDTGLSDVVLW